MNRIEQLLKLKEESPKDPFIKHALALEYLKIGDEVQAQIMFEDNLNNDPYYVATYYHLGKLKEQLASVEEACEVYLKGIEVAKANSDSKTMQELTTAYESICTE